MKIPSYLQRNRYGIFHFRRAVPECLRNIIGKREIVRSLRTREPCEAVQLSRLAAMQVERVFQEARMSKRKSIKTEYTFEFEYPDGTKEKKKITPQDIVSEMPCQQVGIDRVVFRIESPGNDGIQATSEPQQVPFLDVIGKQCPVSLCGVSRLIPGRPRRPHAGIPDFH